MPNFSSSNPPPRVSRPLILGWSLWLLGCWITNLGVEDQEWIDRIFAGAKTIPEDLFVSPARGYVMGALLGIAVIWPLIRLSSAAVRISGVQIAIDLVCLQIIAQLTLIPLSQLAVWSPARAMMVNLSLTIWSLPLGLIVWHGLQRSSPASRAGSMLLCLMLPTVGLIAPQLGAAASWARWSPFYQLWILTSPQRLYDPAAEGLRLAAVSILTAALALFMMLRPVPAGGNPEEPAPNADSGDDPRT